MPFNFRSTISCDDWYVSSSRYSLQRNEDKTDWPYHGHSLSSASVSPLSTIPYFPLSLHNGAHLSLLFICTSRIGQLDVRFVAVLKHKVR